MAWVAELKQNRWLEDYSLYNLMFAVEKTLGHPVQIFHDDFGGTIRHARTAEVVGTVRKTKDLTRDAAPATPR